MITWKFAIVVLIVALVALTLGILTRPAAPAVARVQGFDTVRMGRCMAWAATALNERSLEEIGDMTSIRYTNSYEVALVQLAIFRYKCEVGE